MKNTRALTLMIYVFIKVTIYAFHYYYINLYPLYLMKFYVG